MNDLAGGGDSDSSSTHSKSNDNKSWRDKKKTGSGMGNHKVTTNKAVQGRVDSNHGQIQTTKGEITTLTTTTNSVTEVNHNHVTMKMIRGCHRHRLHLWGEPVVETGTIPEAEASVKVDLGVDPEAPVEEVRPE